MKILLITPPLTQLNTPYPAICYLQNFLSDKGIESEQADLGIELFLRIFSRDGLTRVFSAIEKIAPQKKSGFKKILKKSEEYIYTIDAVIQFLQTSDASLAYRIVSDNFLPMDGRLKKINQDDMDWAFGTMGLVDKAKYLCTIYLENLNAVITGLIDPEWGVSRYAEKLALSTPNFSVIEELILKRRQYPALIDELYLDLFKERILKSKPDIVALTVPFPGNLYFALKSGLFLKEKFSDVKIIMGGGYVNTELREVKAKAFFNYIDYLTLDNGEGPLLGVYNYLENDFKEKFLSRTFLLKNENIQFFDNARDDCGESGLPDYSGLDLKKYLSFIEQNNPMHRLWSDGCWIKLTLAHGCYWQKCTFCDTSLDYIKNYQPHSIQNIADKIEKLVIDTGQRGFHFVDEAAPPALLKELALELIKRKLVISWWTNIRFEKSFNFELCRLLAQSGCVAVSGGLEVASRRILKLINKGVTVEQAAQVTSNFSENGIMVHAYLMYGFPTQSEQETIDSLEIVRQLFVNNCIQSGYWHHFAMTAHSMIGNSPENFNVILQGPEKGDFACNDLFHVDSIGCEHGIYGPGLKKALYNYMHGIGVDYPVNYWFDFKVKKTSHRPDYISKIINVTSHF